MVQVSPAQGGSKEPQHSQTPATVSAGSQVGPKYLHHVLGLDVQQVIPAPPPIVCLKAFQMVSCAAAASIVPDKLLTTLHCLWPGVF